MAQKNVIFGHFSGRRSRFVRKCLILAVETDGFDENDENAKIVIFDHFGFLHVIHVVKITKK